MLEGVGGNIGAASTTVVLIPIGRDDQGLPMGVQLVGRRWDDERLLAIATTLAEVAGPFRRPPGY